MKRRMEIKGESDSTTFEFLSLLHKNKGIFFDNIVECMWNNLLVNNVSILKQQKIWKIQGL